MKNILKALPAILVIAVVVHLFAVWYTPRLIMGEIISRSAEVAGGYNRPAHSAPMDHTARRVVLPSPDLLYSSCTIDASTAPVRVSATPPASYFSLSVFDEITDNVFVVNDQGAGGQPLRLLIAGPGTPVAVPGPGETLVRMPSDRGLLLLRALAATPDLAAGADAARHTLACVPAS